jgi:hypothetical protein
MADPGHEDDQVEEKQREKAGKGENETAFRMPLRDRDGRDEGNCKRSLEKHGRCSQRRERGQGDRRAGDQAYATLEYQPAHAGHEAADDRERDEPHQASQFEVAEEDEEEAGRDRGDHRCRNDGGESCSRSCSPGHVGGDRASHPGNHHQRDFLYDRNRAGNRAGQSSNEGTDGGREQRHPDCRRQESDHRGGEKQTAETDREDNRQEPAHKPGNEVLEDSFEIEPGADGRRDGR